MAFALEVMPEKATRAPVLFVHGWWGGAWVWDRFMSRFASHGHPCFAINLRGYHDDVDVGQVSFADHVEDIRRAVDKIGDPVLVTHSAAGHAALKLGEQRRLPAVIHLVPTRPRASSRGRRRGSSCDTCRLSSAASRCS